ncbi:hypothetical protein GCM10027422_15000 [Hymenobacter arcticus]
MVSSVVTFTCWKKDEPIEIQLEPEALIFKVLPGNEITFKGTPLAGGDFEWGMRIDHENQGIQLFPSKWPHKIAIFEDGVLLEDWYKYM